MDFLHDAAHVLSERIGSGSAFAFLVLTLALLVGPRLAERARIPAMVGLVLAGMLVGPHGFKVLKTDEIALSAWGQFGLLYLMFAAGLELDLRLFARMKKAGLTFAALSFVIPFSLGILSARLLGYDWPGATLMGSNWGSHTLVTYPMLRQMGLARNRAVATVVGATAVTDTSALLVLTGVTASVKKAGNLGVQALEVAAGLAVLAAFTLLVLPRIARWFFGAVGTQSAYRFVFGMVALLTGAVLAEAASIDGIVGAFFAGLGLTRAVPERSGLMDRVQFLGSALFIPIFLVSVGTLLDPRVLSNPKTLGVALIFALAVLGGKALAAIAAGRIFRFEWSEIGVMSGLSGSQAAATLATTLVGSKLGVFDKETINAVLVVILISLIVTPLRQTREAGDGRDRCDGRVGDGAGARWFDAAAARLGRHRGCG
jgi:Kef-type K+ transport system membrane component KefB